MHRKPGNAISIRFALPSAALAPYVTTYYCTEVTTSPAEQAVEDFLHPEWANLRFVGPGCAHYAMGDEPLQVSPAFAATGPTSRATRFRIGSGRSWGIGLMPLGWASLIGADASAYADRVVDAERDSAFAAFRPLARDLAAAGGDFAAELAVIEAHMEGIAANAVPAQGAIAAINAALVDPDLATVGELAARVGMNVRSLERLSKRAFGFTPKLLLRRQRFLRCLAQFMLDPSLKWLSTLDCQYHDQAHFVREFRSFMGMSPSDYARLDKPILVAAARARMAIAGEAVQGLARPARGGR